MKIVTKKWGGESYDWGVRPSGFKIIATTENEQREYRLTEGEPEDMIFGRNLQTPTAIQDMIKLAYDAGRQGEPLIFEEEKVE